MAEDEMYFPSQLPLNLVSAFRNAGEMSDVALDFVSSTNVFFFVLGKSY